MKKSIAILLLSAGIFTAKYSSAQTTATSSTSASTGTSIANDTAAVNFITQASLGNLKEIETGKIAIKKAKKASVKAYGATMIKDHTKATVEMKQILASKQFTVPALSATDTAADAMLTNATGTEFDKNYITMMLMDHVKTVQVFKNAIANVQDPDLKAFAVKTLPVIQEHLKMDIALAKEMNIKTAM